jgi:mono/diheme cytochrome c family protein
MMRLRSILLAAITAITITIPGQLMAETSGNDMVERGKYLVVVTGCNDCHTAGYLLSQGDVPEEEWLTGNPVGWRGPWGTTYGANLRTLVDSLTSEQWVVLTKTLKARPPMPWFNLNALKEQDSLAMYEYIRHLGPAGAPAPAYVPPDQSPKTPYSDLTVRSD